MSSQLDKIRETAEAMDRARAERDAAIRAARPEHTIRLIADAAGLSFQRVQQIIHGR